MNLKHFLAQQICTLLLKKPNIINSLFFFGPDVIGVRHGCIDHKRTVSAVKRSRLFLVECRGICLRFSRMNFETKDN